jgi:DNA-3-methyladenine glycosylase I
MAATLHDDGKKRCFWANPKNPLYIAYHDKEWGVPVHDDRLLFEFLVLESFQAGLSWEIVLNKRKGFEKAFANFDPKKVAKFTEKNVLRLKQDASIIRNEAKIRAAVNNAQRFLELQKEFGSFDKYQWSWTKGKPIYNRWTERTQIPATSKLSDDMAADLKKRGFKFLGSTVMYAHLQATGVINDHLVSCFRHKQLHKR